MTDGWLSGKFAEEANDRFSAAYDDFNHRYLNVQWTGRLAEKAEQVGTMQGRRLLDLGCGTGLSFLPMLDRGWEVVACDVSQRMVDIATSKANGRAFVLRADLRELPVLGEFDLVWAVNDAMNYMLSASELEAGLEGIERNLAAGGVGLFDLNTLESYRTFFAEEFVVEQNGRRFIWSGRVDPTEASPGMIAEARFEAVGEPGSVHVHRQRHFPEDVVQGAMKAAGLHPIAVYGELEGELDHHLSESKHSKAVHLCVHSGAPIATAGLQTGKMAWEE